MTTSTSTRTRRPRGARRLAFIPVFLLLAGGLFAGVWWFSTSSGDANESQYTTFRVRKAPLLITLIENGTLDATHSAKIVSEVEGQREILKIYIQDGQVVRKGAKLAELDVSELDDRIRSQETVVLNADAGLASAEADLAKQKITNEDEIAQAKLNLDLAENDLKKYLEGDFPKDLQNLQTRINLAQADKLQLENTLEWSEKLFKNGYLTQNELDRDRISVEKAKADLKLQQLELAVLKDYEREQQIKRLEGEVASKRRDKQKADLTAVAEIKIRGAKLRSAQETLQIEQDKLAKYKRQLKAGTLMAPRDGLVIFGTVSRGRWGSRDEAIEEGVTVREGQTIFVMPDTNEMMVHTSIQEAMHNRVFRRTQNGNPDTLEGRPVKKNFLRAKVRVAAMGGKEFDGELVYVSPTHDKGASWINPDLKIYPARIKLEGPTTGLRPGMSCTAEIIVEEIPNSLLVPIQAVRNVDGRNICMVLDGEVLRTVDVEVGKDNGLFVQILSGLKEGDAVQVSRAALATGKALDSSKEQDSESATQPQAKPGAPLEKKRGDRSARKSRGEKTPGGAARSGEGGRRQGRGGMDPAARARMESQLKKVATPAEWAQYQEAKKSNDRKGMSQIFRKYATKLFRGNGGGGGPK